MAKRSRIQIARAVQRVANEGPVLLSALVELAGVSERALQRWTIEGKHGIFLDGLHRPGVGWLSSRAAVQRFLKALEAWEAHAAQQPPLPAA